MRFRAYVFSSFVIVCGPHLTLGQDAGNEKGLVDSFGMYVQQHLASHEHNRHPVEANIGPAMARRETSPADP
jgi:hypothetical protein